MKVIEVGFIHSGSVTTYTTNIMNEYINLCWITMLVLCGNDLDRERPRHTHQILRHLRWLQCRNRCGTRGFALTRP